MSGMVKRVERDMPQRNRHPPDARPVAGGQPQSTEVRNGRAVAPRPPQGNGPT